MISITTTLNSNHSHCCPRLIFSVSRGFVLFFRFLFFVFIFEINWIQINHLTKNVISAKQNRRKRKRIFIWNVKNKKQTKTINWSPRVLHLFLPYPANNNNQLFSFIAFAAKAACVWLSVNYFKLCFPFDFLFKYLHYLICIA